MVIGLVVKRKRQRALQTNWKKYFSLTTQKKMPLNCEFWQTLLTSRSSLLKLKLLKLKGSWKSWIQQSHQNTVILLQKSLLSNAIPSFEYYRSSWKRRRPYLVFPKYLRKMSFLLWKYYYTNTSIRVSCKTWHHIGSK